MLFTAPGREGAPTETWRGLWSLIEQRFKVAPAVYHLSMKTSVPSTQWTMMYSPTPKLREPVPKSSVRARPTGMWREKRNRP
jgi:hypothetical protein